MKYIISTGNTGLVGKERHWLKSKVKKVGQVKREGRLLQEEGIKQEEVGYTFNVVKVQ